MSAHAGPEPPETGALERVEPTGAQVEVLDAEAAAEERQAQEVHVDQVTALYLALRARSYEEIAQFVHWEPSSVRGRVHAMLEQIGGDPPRGLTGDDRACVMDYLLQQTAEDTGSHQRALAVLRRSGPARTWARGVVAELREIAPPEAYFPDLRRPPRIDRPGSVRRPKGADPEALRRAAAGPGPVRRAGSVALQLAVLVLIALAYWIVVTHGQVLDRL
jgi:hypothetical protein